MIASLIPFNSRSNQAQVTYWESLGKPIVPTVFFQETTIHFIIYGGRQLLVWRKTVMQTVKPVLSGNPRGML